MTYRALFIFVFSALFISESIAAEEQKKQWKNTSPPPKKIESSQAIPLSKPLITEEKFSHWKLGVDFLWWGTYHLFPVSTIASDITEDLPLSLLVEKYQRHTVTTQSTQVNKAWNPGIRCFADYLFEQEKIDIQCSLCHYMNNGKAAIEGIPLLPSILLPDTVDPKFALNQGLFHLNYNVFDLEMGKNYINGNMLWRPFCSLRTAWISQKERLLLEGYVSITEGQETRKMPVYWKANFDASPWYVGPRLGVSTSWLAHRKFSLITNLSTALLYGRTHQNISTDWFKANIVGQALEIYEEIKSESNRFMTISPTVQLALGGKWTHQNKFNKKFEIYLEWESNFWWNTSQFFSYDKPLAIQGLTGGVSFSF